MKGDRVGAFTIGAPCGQWGGGFFAARDDAGARFVLQRAFDVEAAALSREAAWRKAHPHANMPRHVDDGAALDGNTGEAAAWLAYAGVVAVPVEHALGVYAVPVVLSWAGELVDVMLQHARSAAETEHGVGVSLRAKFSELLVTRDGALLVLTPPSLARTWQSEHLRTSRLDGAMWAPELRESGAPTSGRTGSSDVFAVGGFVREMLRQRADDPRRDISARTALLVQRATGPLDGRHESLDELAHDVRACLAEFPPLDAAERAQAVLAIAGDALASADKELDA